MRVKSIHPGGVATPMGGGDMMSQLEAVGETNPPLNLMDTTFLEQTFAEPEEISNVMTCGGSQYF